MTNFIGGGSGAPAATSHPDLVGRTSSLDPFVMLFGLSVLMWLCYQCWRAEKSAGRNWADAMTEVCCGALFGTAVACVLVVMALTELAMGWFGSEQRH